ncbi:MULTISPECIES: hypothetical protein [Flavobacteriaceae]|uniref:STAS/SEC14 domain-containing protein n=2 Tax=Flavobacteriaceae TaxID=49546 RepID=A0A4Y8AU76_9FLAO|nr:MULTISPECIES: hypothetical protein [Flavobacteriaceae]TEW75451.1 hypothetical protein E2488_08030 [Gramella jeungdoensis]GGK45288.1 hypothetical protein GCM10007963_11890 [Lutibacter litoralis]
MADLKSSYKIIAKHNIIIEYHKGNIDVNSYIKFKEKIFNDKGFKTGLNYLIHFKNVRFLTPPEDIIKFVNFIKKNTPKLGRRKIAFITRTPDQVVKTTIYKTLLADVEQQVAVFSTNNTALNWLNSTPLNTNDLIEVLTVIEKEFEG